MAQPLTCFIVTIHQGSDVSQKVVEGPSFTLGRSFDNILCINDLNVSRLHLQVQFKKSSIQIEDQNSANGTWVNEQKIAAKKWISVQASDRIRLGQSDIYLQIATLEKVFRPENIKMSALSSSEKEALVALIEGAHAEALRLEQAGEEIQQRIIQSAEKKAQKDLQNSMLEIENQKNILMHKNNTLAQDLLKKAQEEAAEILEKAQAEASALQSSTQLELKNLLLNTKQESQKKSEEILESAHLKAQKLETEALQKGQESVKKIIQEQEQQWQTEKLFLQQKFQDQLQKDHAQRLQELQQIQLKIKESETHHQQWLLQIEAQKMELEHTLKQQELDWHSKHNEQKKSLELKIKELQFQIEILEKEEVSLKEAQEQRKKIFDLDWKNLQERQQQELQKSKDQHQKELDQDWILQNQKLDLLKKQKIEEAEAWVKNQELSWQHRQAELEEKFQSYQLQVQDLEAKSKSFNEQTLSLQQNLQSITQDYQQQKSLLEQQQLESHLLSKKQQDLQQNYNQLLQQKQDLEKQLPSIESQTKQQILDLKSQLESDKILALKKHETIMQDLKSAEIEFVKKSRENWNDFLESQKKALVESVLQSLQKQTASLNGEDSIRKFLFSPDCLAQIDQVFTQSVTQLNISLDSTHTTDDKVKNYAHKKKQQKWLQWGQGATLGIALSFLLQTAYNEFQNNTNPMKTAALEAAQKRAADLEKRKFNPEQTSELKNSYTDSVIYTENFVENYLAADFQKKWLKTATEYMFKQWRVQEEVTIQVLSSMQTLVQTLQMQREKIHPDFIQRDIEKMHQLENEKKQEWAQTLGSMVRLESLLQLEKTAFTEALWARSPAKDSSDSH